MPDTDQSAPVPASNAFVCRTGGGGHYQGVTSPATFARRAKHHPVLEALTRMGLVGFGLTHLLVAWIALRIASGDAPTAGDQDGAFRILVAQQLGKVLLTLVAIGLVAMVVWQVLEAAVGHTSLRGGERIAERLMSAGRAIFYGYLAYAAYKVLQAKASGSAGAKQEQAASTLSEPGGRWIVGLIGVGVLLVGLGLIVYGVIRRFERHLKTGEMSGGERRAARLLGVIGYVAKGAVYAIAGWLVLSAALNYDPEKTRGLDSALHTLAGQPRGDILLTAMAAGIATFAIFCFFQARYRKV
jgi:hypothetical protein